MLKVQLKLFGQLLKSSPGILTQIIEFLHFIKIFDQVVKNSVWFLDIHALIAPK